MSLLHLSRSKVLRTLGSKIGTKQPLNTLQEVDATEELKDNLVSTVFQRGFS